MIKQTLIATAFIAGLAAPAFAADNGHHDRGRNDAHQPQPTSHQTYQRQYQQPQRQYQQPRYGSNNGNGNGYAYGRQQYHPRIAPPRARYEQRGTYRRGYAWQPGYYQYDNSQQYNSQPYNWIPGQYVQQPYANAQYQPLNWQLLNGLWTLLGGNWQ